MTLVVARLVQGGFGSLMAAQVLTCIQLVFVGPARGRALGWYAAVLAGSAVIGQAMGGVLVSADVLDASWRPVFLINVPLGVLLLVAALRLLPVDRAQPHRELDLAGAAVLTAALLLVVAPLMLGREAGWPVWTWVCLVAAVPAFALFVWVERRLERRGGHPLLNLRLLARPAINWALGSLALSGGVYIAILFVLALYLQDGLRHSPAYSGLVLVPWVAAFGVAGPLLVTLLALGGLGWGAQFSGLLTHLTSAVTGPDAPDVSGLFNTALRVSGVMGVAGFGTAYLALASLHDRDNAVASFTVTTVAMAGTALVAALLAYLGHTPTPERSPRKPDPLTG